MMILAGRGMKVVTAFEFQKKNPVAVVPVTWMSFPTTPLSPAGMKTE